MRVTVGIVVIAILLARADLGQVRASLGAAEPALILAALAVLLAGLVVGALRWRAYLGALDLDLPVPTAVRMHLAGVFFNAFLPTGIGGDAYKAVRLSRGSSRAPGHPTLGPAIGSVVLDRFAGAVALGIVGVIFATAALASGGAGRVPATALAVSVVLLGGAGVVLWRGERLLWRRVVPEAGLGARLRSAVRTIHDAARDPRAVPRAYLLGIVFHACVLVEHVLIARALGIHVSLTALACIVVVASLMTMIPVTINGLGFREGAYVWGLGAFGIAGELALAFGLVILAVVLLSSAVGGLVYMTLGGDVSVSRPALRARRWRSLAPIGLVAAAVVFNLVTLRAEATPVWNLNDSAMHAQMVRWADDRIAERHVPFDGWYPNLSLGAPHFHHYQSIPHTLTGTASRAIGADHAFALSLYLLMALWPICVYASARLLGWGRWAAAAGAVVSPLVVSVPGHGYELGSYVWQGYGVWSQLWAMWTLPIAWALGWRAIRRGRGYAIAAVAVASTIAIHFLTGYLAVASLGALAFVGAGVVKRVGRAVLLGAGAVVVASWVVVPLLADSPWMNQTSFGRNDFYTDSFGARTVLGWLVTGGLFDAGRLPVVTLLVGIGLVVCIARARRDERARVLLALWSLSLFLFIGRPTFGPVIDLLPGGRDLLLHRYLMGVHLAGIFIAGAGALWLARALVARARATTPVSVAAVIVVGLTALSPAWLDRAAYHREGARWIDQQRAATVTDGAELAALVAEVERRADGRIYAGLRSNWGDQYRVGFVPVNTALATLDADAIGFTFRTGSLLSDLEALFDETNPAHYDLFNVRYLILPSDRDPPVPATVLDRRARHTLWEVPTHGYVQLVDTVGSLVADRSSMARQIGPFLASPELARAVHPTVAFAGSPPAIPTAVTGVPSTPPGRAYEQLNRLDDGIFGARVVADRRAVVLLKASYHPRWRVMVDGAKRAPIMVAPGMPGVVVEPGEHLVLFEYVPYQGYAWLLGAGAIALLVLALIPRVRSGRRQDEQHPVAAQPFGQQPRHDDVRAEREPLAKTVDVVDIDDQGAV